MAYANHLTPLLHTMQSKHTTTLSHYSAKSSCLSSRLKMIKRQKKTQAKQTQASIYLSTRK